LPSAESLLAMTHPDEPPPTTIQSKSNAKPPYARYAV
jgi:hypothetical protein